MNSTHHEPRPVDIRRAREIRRGRHRDRVSAKQAAYQVEPEMSAELEPAMSMPAKPGGELAEFAEIAEFAELTVHVFD